jgi:hypothetical protein
MPITMTQRAALSEKSRPSDILPLQTPIKMAPPSGLTSFLPVFCYPLALPKIAR